METAGGGAILNISSMAAENKNARMAALMSVLTPEIEQAMLKHTPLKRLGEGRDVAYAALFLCSPAAAWISGQVLTVSGGGVQELD
jgi:7-alpha-hydroxysteroid dehydrogenase